MKKCKCVGCKNKVKDTVYCSASCRTKTTNLLYKDYSKVSSKLSDAARIPYEASPKYCVKCRMKLSYEKRMNKFCGRSCSVSYINLGRVWSDEVKSKIRASVNSRIPVRPIKFCKCCNKELIRKQKVYCSYGCGNKYRHSKLDKKRAYRLECKFNFALNEYPDKFDFDLIRKYGWYKAKNHGDNVGGVTRDHLFSVEEGYINNIPSEQIRHPANCQLLVFGKNVSKGKASSITHDE